MMVEVFKTNVNNRNQSILLLQQIHENNNDYSANFDLDDVDCILRVENSTGQVDANWIIDLLKNFGFNAEVLADEYYSY